MEYLPGVHVVPGVRGCRVFLLTEGPLSLVDAGLPGSASAVLRYVERLGYAPGALERVLLTHRHTDHVGGASELRRLTGARVYAHRAETETTDGLPVLRGRGVPVDCLLEDAERLEGGIRVVHVGGHTAGAVCFVLEGRRAVFVGDIAINNIDRLSRPLPWSNEEGDEAFERALRLVAAVDVDSAFFGHGPPLIGGAGSALRELSERSPGPMWQRMLRLLYLRLRFALSRGGQS